MPSDVIPCSLQRFLLLHSQIRQDLGLVFSGCNNLMACRAIIGNGLAIGTSMATIVAAETAQRVIVPKIVWVCTPGHTHVWKDVSQVYIRHFLGSLLHRGPLRSIDFRIV